MSNNDNTDSTDESIRGAGSLLTRRELLGASAALGTAAIASGGGAVGSADAQTSEEPRIQLGEDYAIDDNPDGEGDLVLEHLASGAQFRYDSSEDSWSMGSVSAESIGKERHYAGSFDGGNPDQRLDNALSAASDGDIVYLEAAEYNADRTIDTLLRLEGTGQLGPSGTVFNNASLTFDNRVLLTNMAFYASTPITINGGRSMIRFLQFGISQEITISANDVGVFGCEAGNVTFDSGTDGGIVDACWNGMVVTDNGSNTVGDIG